MTNDGHLVDCIQENGKKNSLKGKKNISLDMCEFLVVFTSFCRGKRTSDRLLLYSSDAANSQYTRMDSSDVASC